MVGLSEIHVSLRGSGGEEATGEAFFEAIGAARQGDLTYSPSNSAWKSARIELFHVEMQELAPSDEPYERFAEAVEAGFLRAAEFLAGCDVEGIQRWRSAGRQADVFIGGWLLNEQFDLSIPAAFLAQCGRLSLPIRICTND